MKLSSIRVKNFKSIIDSGYWGFSGEDNIMVIAGQNEAGKSALLEALDFFGNGPSKNFIRLQKRTDDSIAEVICSYNLEKNEIRELSMLCNRLGLKSLLEGLGSVELVRGGERYPKFKALHLIDPARKEIQDFFDKAELRKSPKSPEKDTPPPTEDQPEGTGVVPQEPVEDPYPIKTINQLESALASKTRGFIFYGDDFDNLLPGEIRVDQIPNNRAVLDFEEVFDVKFAEIVKQSQLTIRAKEQAIKKIATDDLNKYWTQSLEAGGKYNFSVEIQKVGDTPPELQFLIDRDDLQPLYMEQKSKGFRWFSAFNLRLRAHGVKKEMINNLVLLIDEPGQGLHEKAQQDLKLVIEELASRGAQVIYATHNPQLIGTEGEEFARIRIVSNTKAKGTKAETVTQFSSRPNVGAKDALSPLVTAMGLQSALSLVNTGDKLNVIVEGISDHYYLTVIRDYLKKSKKLYFIPGSGVDNLPNIVSIMLGWGLDYKAVFDDDAKQGRKAYNLLKKHFFENDDELAHKHIHKLKGRHGIEDMFSYEDFHEHILGVPIPKTKPKSANSELANGKKEIYARLFSQKLATEKIKLTNETIKNFQEVFDWLDSVFNIK